MAIKKLSGTETLEELRQWALDTQEEYKLVKDTNDKLTDRNKQLEESNQQLFLRAMASKKEETEEETKEFKSKLLNEEMVKHLSDEELEILKEMEEDL